MTDETVNKEVFTHNMKTIHKSLDRLHTLVEKLFERQEEMNVVLTKNTVVVKAHHARSNRLETVVEDISQEFIKLAKDLMNTKNNVDNIKKSVNPMKEDIKEMNTTVSFIQRIPTALKVIALLLTVATSAIGLFTIVDKTFNTPVVKAQDKK